MPIDAKHMKYINYDGIWIQVIRLVPLVPLVPGVVTWVGRNHFSVQFYL